MFMCQCKICGPQDGIFKPKEKQFEQTQKSLQCTYQLSNLVLVVSRSSLCTRNIKHMTNVARPITAA